MRMHDANSQDRNELLKALNKECYVNVNGKKERIIVKGSYIGAPGVNLTTNKQALVGMWHLDDIHWKLVYKILCEHNVTIGSEKFWQIDAERGYGISEALLGEQNRDYNERRLKDDFFRLLMAATKQVGIDSVLEKPGSWLASSQSYFATGKGEYISAVSIEIAPYLVQQALDCVVVRFQQDLEKVKNLDKIIDRAGAAGYYDMDMGKAISAYKLLGEALAEIQKKAERYRGMGKIQQRRAKRAFHQDQVSP